jgi:hypothetical protein
MRNQRKVALQASSHLVITVRVQGLPWVFWQSQFRTQILTIAVNSLSNIDVGSLGVCVPTADVKPNSEILNQFV